MSRHSFDPDVAALVGLPAAVLYQNISWWIEKNEANDHNFRDGQYWTYNSIAAFAKLFRYLSEKQIRTAIDKLVEVGLLIKGNHNDDPHDRTAWYALREPICPAGQIELPGRANGPASQGKSSDLQGKCLENSSNPDEKPPSRTREAAAEFEQVWEAYPADRRRGRNACARLVAAALAEVPLDQLLAAVRAYAAETSGFTRSKVCYSDNWLREERWRRYLGAAQQREADADASLDQVLARAAEWVKARSAMCRHVSPAHAVMAVERGLISRDQAHAAGVMR